MASDASVYSVILYRALKNVYSRLSPYRTKRTYVLIVLRRTLVPIVCDSFSPWISYDLHVVISRRFVLLLTRLTI